MCDGDGDVIVTRTADPAVACYWEGFIVWLRVLAMDWPVRTESTPAGSGV